MSNASHEAGVSHGPKRKPVIRRRKRVTTDVPQQLRDICWFLLSVLDSGPFLGPAFWFPKPAHDQYAAVLFDWEFSSHEDIRVRYGKRRISLIVLLFMQ